MNTKKNRRFACQGFSLVELIVAISIFAVLISGVTFLAVGSYGPYVGAGNSREKERLAREALQLLQTVKQQSWTQIDTYDDNTSVKVTKNASGNWVLSAGTETRGSFVRDIKIATVQRDSSGVIVTSGGTDDPSTKKATITISATGKTDFTIETYLINWESYRMAQTDWSGAAATNIWTSGTNNYYSSTTADGMHVTGELRLASST